MVIIDQLRISDNGKQLYVNAHIPDLPGFEDIYLSRITVKTADQASETAEELATGEYVYDKEIDNTKTLELIIDSSNLLDDGFNGGTPIQDFTKDLFVVYIATTDNYPESVCCPYSCNPTVGITFDETLLYQKVMGYTKQLHDFCNTPNKEFIDFILLWNAFKASVETEHYVSARKFYKMLFGSGNASVTKNCGCHG